MSTGLEILLYYGEYCQVLIVHVMREGGREGERGGEGGRKREGGGGGGR